MSSPAKANPTSDMSTNRLTHDEFFDQLSDLFAAQRQATHGSVYLTQKALTDHSIAPVKGGSMRLDPLAERAPHPLLIRATNGKTKGGHRSRKKMSASASASASAKARRPPTTTGTAKVKLSTVVAPEAVPVFFARYAEVCKANLQALKKRDRSGRKKARAKKRKEAGGGGGGAGGAGAGAAEGKGGVKAEKTV
ncbi:MAG: hypothetical protein M1826_003345 [Phylliscum demangeonii]|nr:MAG: hypothetical protein M1826_003345 [Phylliscum demangeonii]